MLSADNICVKRMTRTVLNQAFLRLQEGTVTAVVGPNGSGKSTLLKAITGELELARGKVKVCGKDMAYWAKHPRELAKFRAVLPQSSTLFFDFKVLDVVLMGRAPHLKGGESQADYDICHRALERVGMEKMAERSFLRLSGGERQRVHLARAIAQITDVVDRGDPTLFLLDEPTANLDLKHQFEVLELARDFADRGAAVMIVLHDLQQARQYADQVLMLRRGHVAGFGDAMSILSEARISTVFEVQARWQGQEKDALLSVRPKPRTSLENMADLF